MAYHIQMKETDVVRPWRTDDGASRRQGSEYILTKEEIDEYHREGYISLPNVLSEEECQEIEKVFARFMNQEIPVPGKDFCDMSSAFGKPIPDFNMINAMLPREYLPEWKGNIFEQRAASISRQLLGPDMKLDYDQLLAKKPHKPEAVFAWHQDLAYWPQGNDDPRTATVSLALDNAGVSNGCLRLVPGTQKEKELRRHRPVAMQLKKTGEVNKDNRDEAHALELRLEENDVVHYQCVLRGGVTVHDERIIHGSAGNNSDNWRRTYVIAFRSEATVAWERAMGFTHSHNDTVNWDTFNSQNLAQTGETA